MLKPVHTSLLFVIIFFSFGLSADEKRDDWKREDWETYKRVDDLTDELIFYQAWMTYSDSLSNLHRLIVRCDMETQDLAVWIFSLTGTGRFQGQEKREEEVTLEYRFNQESALKEVWKKKLLTGSTTLLRLSL